MSTCIQCHARPRYPGHQYCGKTCADVAATAKSPPNQSGNCMHCHAKPKYAGHPYCGKTCASAATAAAKVSSSANTNSGANCIRCHVKPKYNGHPYCGKSCAMGAAAANPSANSANNCNHCHVKPKANGHPYCGKTCANAAAVVSASTNPAGNCIHCHVKPKFNGHPYCGKACANAASAAGPALVHLQPSHQSYVSVSNQFKAKWQGPGPAPQIRHIYQVIPSPSVKQAYDAYRNSVDSSPHFTRKPNMSPGNEHRRWHGTKRTCQLGDNPTQTAFCSNQGCALCSILRTTLRVPTAGKPLEFGPGIYTSSTANKAARFSSNPPGASKALILVKVVVGKGYKLTKGNPSLTQPPQGHHSVLGTGGDNIDEVIVYRSDATCPAYLVIHD